MFRIAPRLVLALLPLCVIAAESPAPPKLRLPATVVPKEYQVALTLDPTQPAFSGSITIQAEVKQPVEVVWLNATGITVQEASFVSGSKTLAAQPVAGGDNFIGLQSGSSLPAGSLQIKIRYTGAVRQQDSSGIFKMEDNGNRYLYTQFESTDARAAFPCFDEPSYKVPWQLTLNVPQADTAVSNTAPLNEQTQGSRKIVTFGRTKPLPSYLVAFAIGPFDFVEAGRAGRNHIPVRIVTPKGHAEEARYAADITATVITRLENYFNIPFPYDKSDQLAIPVTFGFGAMENAGLVTYAQNIILAKPDNDTETRKRMYASVAAHELAHQWFGDLVTTAWWNDIWLNEAFATWMEQKLIAEWKPEWKSRVEDVSSKLHAQREDSLIAARKIRQEIVSKDDISNAFDGITYQKGAAVIGMFENWVGPDQFRQGVSSYLKQYAFRNASAPEFLDAVSSASKKNLSEAFSTFLNQAGVPLVSVKLDCQSGSPMVHLQQERYLPLGSKGSTAQTWQIPVCLRYGTGTKGEQSCTLLTKPQADVALKGSGCPAWLEANQDGVGYYRVNYQGNLLNSLTEGDVTQRLSAPERVDLMGNAESLADGGKLPAGAALQLASKFHDDSEWHVVESALSLAVLPHSHLVAPSMEGNYQRFLLKNFQARAHELGWLPQNGETDDKKLLRPALLPYVATLGGDQELAETARDLTEKWLNGQNVIAPNMLAATLRTAAYYGNQSLFDRLLVRWKKTNDRQERGRILTAMESFRDPAAIEAGMNAILNGNIPFIEGGFLLFAGGGSDSTREMAFHFMQAHFDELAKKRPTGGGFDAGSIFPRVGAAFCDARSRQEMQSFFTPRVEQFTGAPRALSQVLESIDLCIAEKQAQEPSVAEFLKQY